MSELTKKLKCSRNLRRLSVLCFILAAVLFIAAVLLSLPEVQRRLAYINDLFLSVEMFIARFDKLAAVAVILLLFAFKSFISVIPFSVLFIGSGLVFSAPAAVAVNAIGFALLVSIKFWWGKKFGGGGTHKLLLKSEVISKFMKFHGDGNKWMLVILRFIPFIPVGSVSRMYGATDMKYGPYVTLSVLGFLPRLIAWSVVGTNITAPVTPGFLVPVAVLFVISGISLLLLDALYE